MKLNPKKCTFGAVEGMFLGYVVGPEGIKPCPDKVDAVLQLPSPRTIKEVQSLNGKLAGLNRFLSKSAEKSLPLATYTGSTKAAGRIDNVLVRLSWSGWRSPNDRKKHGSDASQILADFLVEKPDDAPADTSVKETPKEVWTLFTDGSSCTDGSGVGLILTSPEGTEFTYALRFQFSASNNEAEYEALIIGLRIAAQIGVRHI
ncbi:reverse transcriptase domain-containing protein [Tanacetum coccineum]